MRNDSRRRGLRVAAVPVGGLAVGALTLLGQWLLPGAWGQLANSGAVWSAAAFAAGCWAGARRRPALVAGTVALWGAVVGYYGCTTVILGQDLSAAALRGPLVWAAVALLAGPLFGTAGRWYRHGSPARRVAGLCLVGGVFVAEGCYLLLVLRYPASAAVVAGVGLAGTLLLAGSARRRVWCLLVLVPAGLLLTGGYLLLTVAVQHAFTV